MNRAANRAWMLAAFLGIGTVLAFLYAQVREIPMNIAARALPAFLLEGTFFLCMGLEDVRARLEKLPRMVLATLLTASCVVPYCVASLAFGSFHLQALGWIALLAGAVSFWYVILPHRAATDILFLVMLAAVALTRFLRDQYVDPHPRLPLNILGYMMWIRAAAFALLSLRKVQGIGFGFWPRPQEWKVGALYYLLFLPVAIPAAWAVGFARPHVPSSDWEKTTVLALGTFFGFLWVAALGAEFFFRGLLQQWLGQWMRNDWAGLAVASVLFGLAHLWFRPFPNWRFAAIATVGGVFYGLAFRKSRSIRAPVVTHALTVTTWRVFFS